VRVNSKQLPLVLLALSAATASVSLSPPRCAAAQIQAKTKKPQAATVPPISALRVDPALLSLRGAYSDGRVLVDGIGRGPSGDTQRYDLTASAKYESADRAVATIDADGGVRPHHNGKTRITVRAGGHVATVTVSVTGIVAGTAPSFLNEVLPVLTHAGCNMGACHGAAAGKGGFRLSLLAYDPALDIESITRAAGARRICRAQPENSLLLRKPTYSTPHRGGKRLEVGSADYRLLTDWIAAGCPGPNPKDSHVVALEITPSLRTLAVGQTQKFLVRAHYGDGSTRDATDEAIFTASDETTATVTPAGLAKATGPGEGAVVVRYQGLVVTARVGSPFAPPIKSTPSSTPPRSESASNAIDRQIKTKLDSLGLIPSPNCSDGDFMRRASLDITGQLPTAEQARTFLNSHEPDRRVRLVDSLLATPEYVDFWTMKWADLLHCTRDGLTDKGMYTLNGWIHNAVNTNMPWDQFTRAVLVASGDTYRDGPANFYLASASPEQRAEDASQVFLGVRISCAKCHNHPYDRWTQNQYYQMAAFFARLGTKAGTIKGEAIIFSTDSGETRNPKSQQTVAPCALIDSAPLPADFTADRRGALADWITSPRNPYFTHEIVNRVWRHFMGRGFIEAVDDIKATNPPSNAPLFDFLAGDFGQHGFDVKRLIRSVVLSQTYQRCADPNATNRADKTFYSHFMVRRLGAEQMLDALSQATGVPEKFTGYPMGVHAASLADTQTPSYFLDLFGRPARTTTCACERMDDPNLSQALHMMNSGDINTRLASKTGRISTLLAASLPDTKMVEELYLTCFTRLPNPFETKRAIRVLAATKDKRVALEDLTWALINSNEFRFNH